MNNEKYFPKCREGYPIPLASRITISELRAKILERQSTNRDSNRRTANIYPAVVLARNLVPGRVNWVGSPR